MCSDVAHILTGSFAGHRELHTTRVRARYLHFITITPDDARHHQHITHCDIVCAHMVGAGFACKGHLRTRQSARLRTARCGAACQHVPGTGGLTSEYTAVVVVAPQPEMLSARHVCQHLYSHIAPSQLTCARCCRSCRPCRIII